jgi:hypothetical protein
MDMWLSGKINECMCCGLMWECVTIEGNKNEIGSSGVKKESTDRGM